MANTSVQFVQTSDYPWEGSTSIAVNPDAPAAFTLKVRIPGFNESQFYQPSPYSRTYGVSVNGTAWSGLLDQGYATITRNWKAGDKVDGAAGRHEAVWNAKRVPAGVYVWRIGIDGKDGRTGKIVRGK